MKTYIKNLFLLPALIAGLGLIPAGRVTAQNFTTLHSFTAVGLNSSGYNTNSDGANPYAGLILSGNTLCGTTLFGGSSANGTVFAVNTNGTGFTTLYSFTATPDPPFNTNSDGANPGASLVLSGNTFYGAANNGGSSGNGTVFEVNTDGTGFTNLYSFTATGLVIGGNSDGANPKAGLVLLDNTLYGTASQGGTPDPWTGGSGNGTVFAVNTNGTGFRTLHRFTPYVVTVNGLTNSDGVNPYAGLILSGNTLYGTASGGGSSINGTVFAVNTDGTGFTILHSFTATSGSFGTNSDGRNPNGGLILSGNTLYGTTVRGGIPGSGTVFAVNTNGTGFTTLYSFTADPEPFPYGTNSDGANPQARLVLSDNTLYGTASQGGTSGHGAVFAVNTDGTGFTNLHSFTAPIPYYTNKWTGDVISTNSDGDYPAASLVLSGHTLYGTAKLGGISGNGTVFAVNTLDHTPPDLAITSPANGATIQTLTNITGTASDTESGLAENQIHFTLYNNGNFWSGSYWTNTPVIDPSIDLTASVVSGAWTFTNVPTGSAQGQGTYWVNAFARDNAGNVTTPQPGVNSISFTIDTSPPNVAITFPPNGSTITNQPGGNWFQGTASDDPGNHLSLTLFIRRNSDNLYWTGSGWGDVSNGFISNSYNSGNQTWQSTGALPTPGSSLGNGDYYFIAIATDAAGNTQQVDSVVSVDFHPVFVFNHGSYPGPNPNMSWSDPANWDVGSVPTPDASVIINGYTPDYAGLGSLPLYRLDMSGGTLTTSGMTIQKLNLAGGSLNGGAITIAANGVFNWSGGTIGSGVNLNLPATASFNISGADAKTLAQSNTINTAGNTTWTGAGIINVGYGSVFNNTGSFVAQNDSQFYNSTGNMPLPVFVNNGSFTKMNSPGTTVFNLSSGGVAFNNNGTINIQTGDLVLAGGGAGTNGICTAASGSHIDLTGGSFNWSGNSTISGAGVTRVNGAALTLGGGTTTLTGTFELDSGSAGGTNTFAGTGTFNWTGGSLFGTLTMQSNVAFNLSGANEKVVSAGTTVHLTGITTWTGSGNLNGAYGSQINNTGTFSIQNDAQFYNNNGNAPAPVFNNNGLLQKTNSIGVTTISSASSGWTFNNNGTLDIGTGVLSSQTKLYLNNGSFFAGAGVTRVDSDTTVITGTNTLQPGATFEIAGGTVTGTNTFAGTGAFNWSGGTISAAINLQSNIAFNISSANPKTLSSGGNLAVAGHTLWTGAGLINVGNGSVFNNTGSFVAQNDSQFYNNTGATPLPVFINGGSFTKTNSPGTTVFNSVNGGVAFNNNGTVSVQSGNLTLGGGGTSTSDSFTVAAGSLIDFTAGSFFFNGSRTLTGPGTNRVNGASVTFNHGTNALGGAITFEIAAGVVNGTNTFSGVGTVNWSGGTIGGSCTIPGTVTLNLSGGGVKTLAQNSTINSAGNATWTGAGIINVGYGSVFNNTGTFNVLNDSQFYNNTGATPLPVFNNTGTFRKTGGTNATVFAAANGGVNFNNTGTVDLQTGSLAINGGYTLSGSPQLKLALGGVNPGTQFSQENFAGSATLGGILSVTLTNGFSPTNGQSFAIVTYSSESGQFASQQLPALPNNLAWQVSYGATAVTLNVVGSTVTIITDATRLTNGHFQFTLGGPNAGSVIIQGSTNLLDWTSLQTNTPFTGPLLFDDPQAVGYPIRFYRAVIFP